MKYTVEESLNNFKFWAGAKENALLFTYDEMEQLDYLLEDCLGEDVSDTTINDLFWFEPEFICELLGLEWDEDKCEPVRC